MPSFYILTPSDTIVNSTTILVMSVTSVNKFLPRLGSGSDHEKDTEAACLIIPPRPTSWSETDACLIHIGSHTSCISAFHVGGCSAVVCSLQTHCVQGYRSHHRIGGTADRRANSGITKCIFSVFSLINLRSGMTACAKCHVMDAFGTCPYSSGHQGTRPRSCSGSGGGRRWIGVELE